MKKGLKIISLLLCALFLLSSCDKAELPGGENTTAPSGEVDTQSGQPTSVKGTKSLPFNSADGLNPFYARSDENKFVFSLLYNPLFVPDKNYNAIPIVADSIVVHGNVATVKIKNGIACRGSSSLTAADVVYSFNLAKASYLYSAELLTVYSATASSGNTVDFTLEQPDVFAAGKLNFPIVKAGTADAQTDMPTGSGAYYYSEGKLINSADSAKVITLCQVDSHESSRDALKIGSSDVFFSDLSDCNYNAVAGNTQDVYLNNMVYLGINSANGALNKYVRSAVAAKINSEDIVLSSYEGHAVPAKLPFNPHSYFAGDLKSVAVSGDKPLAESIIDRSGFVKRSNGVRSNGAYTLSFTLIVNNNNRYRLSAAYAVADNLNEIGFSVKVEPLPFEEYNARIAAGNFDMYLGEIKLDGSMDIGVFFKDDTPFGKGVDKTERAAAEYARYRSGEISATEYYGIFAEFYPFVPICFRTGYVVNSSDVSLDLSRAPYSLYYNIA